MREVYPLAVQAFCAWIDKYKKLVNWNELFGEKTDETANYRNYLSVLHYTDDYPTW